MGCDCCEKSDYGKTECKAPLSYRRNFCEVYFPGEHRPSWDGSNYTPPKKKRKK